MIFYPNTAANRDTKFSINNAKLYAPLFTLPQLKIMQSHNNNLNQDSKVQLLGININKK